MFFKKNLHHHPISIPYGAIKRKTNAEIKKSEADISIPYGAIKR